MSATRVAALKTTTIATFSVNGVDMRLANLFSWLKESQSGVICLQELKAEED